MAGFISKLSPEQWAEARRLRAEGASFATIAKRFGMTPEAIATRARKDAWMSPAPGSVVRAEPARGRARVASPATAEVRRNLALRFYRLIEIQIQMLELRMTKDMEAQQKALDAGEPPPPIEGQRENFAALIEQINHVTEMASEPAYAADGRRKPAINPDLIALSSEIDPAALAAASEKDESTARLAQQLAKAVGPA
jgi:hypothetical protein